MRTIKDYEKAIEQATKERDCNKKAYWISGKGIPVAIREMDDSYLINAMKKVADGMARLQFLPECEEFNTYEGIHYKVWLKYFNAEFRYRKVYEDYRVHVEFNKFQNLEALIDDNIPF